MVYSDTTNDGGIVQEARWLVGANATSYPIKDLTRNANRWMDRAVSLIIPASHSWQWDDSNQTDYPIATTDLVSGQQDYTLDTTHLRIERVEIKNESGDWERLTQIDKAQIKGSLEEFHDTDGKPTYYDVTSNSVFLYPASDYSQSASLRVWFQRKGSYFTTTDTTKEPGFAEIFHRYIALGAAYDYALKFASSKVSLLRNEATAMEKEMQAFYSRRNKDFPNRMTPKYKRSK